MFFLANYSCRQGRICKKCTSKRREQARQAKIAAIKLKRYRPEDATEDKQKKQLKKAGFVSSRKEATTGTDRHKIQKTVQLMQAADIKKQRKQLEKDKNIR